MEDNANSINRFACNAVMALKLLNGLSRIPVFDKAENDVQLVTDVKSTEDLEKYEFVNWQLIKQHSILQHILFRLKP
jgi:hypothetical protein